MKGVKADRDQNDSNLDYFYDHRLENEGIRFYLHKYFMGYQTYYMQLRLEKEKLIITEEQERQMKPHELI